MVKEYMRKHIATIRAITLEDLEKDSGLNTDTNQDSNDDLIEDNKQDLKTNIEKIFKQFAEKPLTEQQKEAINIGKELKKLDSEVKYKLLYPTQIPQELATAVSSTVYKLMQLAAIDTDGTANINDVLAKKGRISGLFCGWRH